MSDASTVRLIESYMDEAPPPRFLSGMATRTTFHNSEKVESDIERDDEDVAVVVTDMTAGARRNELSKYTNKEFTPPVFKEEATLNGFELIKRQPGDNPYVDPSYQANAMARTFKVFRRLDWKIQRAKELMWSQVLQTGILTLTDASGAVLVTIDFGMRAEHKAAVSSPWSTQLSAATPLQDIEARARVLRRNGKRAPNQLIFGRTAWQNFWQNTYVQSLLDNRRIEMGGLKMSGHLELGGKPGFEAEDANFEGRLTVGPFTFELWLYDAEYKDPVSETMMPYITADKVIMKSSGSRLDQSYGNIPFPVRPEERVMPFLPGRMSSRERGLDLVTNAYAAPDNTGVVVGAYARPLSIPTAIDTLGCLDTEA